MQTLTVNGVVEACRKALEENRLGAACGERDCKYHYRHDIGCAIGVALDEETLQHVIDKDLNEEGLNSLCDRGLVKIDGDEYETLAELQDKHDYWAGRMGAERLQAKEVFINYLNELEREFVDA